MRSIGILGGLALASCGMTAPAIAYAGAGEELLMGIDTVGPEIAIDASRIDRDTLEVRRALPRGRQRRRRAKGPQAKPRKRSNRLHVSKRTRRKHRRAA